MTSNTLDEHLRMVDLVAKLSRTPAKSILKVFVALRLLAAIRQPTSPTDVFLAEFAAEMERHVGPDFLMQRPTQENVVACERAYSDMLKGACDPEIFALFDRLWALQ